MKINSTSSENVKETNSKSQVKQAEKDENNSFDEEYTKLLAQNANIHGNINPAQIMSIISAQQQNGLGAEGLGGLRTAFNYNTMSISKEDATFFNALVEKTDYVVNQSTDPSSFQTTLLQVVNDGETQDIKSASVSKALMNLIEEAYNTQKPARIDFDNNVSVILKINKDGKLTAEFIPGDKAVEEYLRNNIGYLKSNLEQKNIEYEDILYKPFRNNSKNRRNGGNKNE